PHGHYLSGLQIADCRLKIEDRKKQPGAPARDPSSQSAICNLQSAIPHDSVESQMAALAYVDSCLPPLFAVMRRRGRWFCLVMADHGEAHGEDGRYGHRIAHPSVTTVPYAHFFLA